MYQSLHNSCGQVVLQAHRTRHNSVLFKPRIYWPIWASNCKIYWPSLRRNFTGLVIMEVYLYIDTLLLSTNNIVCKDFN